MTMQLTSRPLGQADITDPNTYVHGVPHQTFPGEGELGIRPI
jgi:hypothetical protein